MSSSAVKVVRFHETGGPDVLKIEKVVLPEPGKIVEAHHYVEANEQTGKSIGILNGLFPNFRKYRDQKKA